MKKIICVILVAIMLVAVLSGCNKQIIDTTYSFERAILTMPNGDVIEGEVTSWNDYEGDQIQVKIDGTTYLVHSSNIVLISE